MIKQLRFRIIVVTMMAITAVVFAISGAINITNSIKLRQRADSMLTLISDYNGSIPTDESELDDKANIDIKITGETQFQTRYFVIYTDNGGNIVDSMTNYIATVGKGDIERLAKLTYFLHDGKRGTIGKYRFLVRNSSVGKMITFLDRSQDLETSMQLFIISVFISCIGMTLIALLLILVSDKIIQPFVRNHEKQKQFITDAGHELKTPLAIIRTNTEVLEMCYGKNEFTDSIKNQTERLDGLVKGLLELSKGGEMKSTERSKFSLSGAVNDIAESFKTMAEQKGHKIHFDITPGIEYTGDAQAISTLVSILVDNAIKYASDGGEIFVSLFRMGKSTSKAAKLVVENDTSLPDDEDPNRFFERFYRSESSRSRQTGGYGIGLSVAKNIVDNHKGKITVTKSNNRIAFTVIL